jgi:hypothetical protein
MQALKFGFGQSVLRKEDDPLLRGGGHYIAVKGEALYLQILLESTRRAPARGRQCLLHHPSLIGDLVLDE